MENEIKFTKTEDLVPLKNETNGYYWERLSAAAIILVVTLGYAYYDMCWQSITLVVLATLFALYTAAGATHSLKPSEAAVFKVRGAFPKDFSKLKFTKAGGWDLWVDPFFEELVIYEVGMFTADIYYKNINLPNLDEAAGKIQLTFVIDVQYFKTLYGITKGALDIETIKAKVLEKLEDTVPRKLSSVAYDLQDKIQTGAQFEEATKERDGELVKRLFQALTFHGEGEPNDCYGLKLKSVEINPPVITGTAYKSEQERKGAEADAKVFEAKYAKWNAFLKAHLKEYRLRRGLKEDDILENSEYEKEEHKARLLFAEANGNNPNFYDGLKNSGTNVNINR